jgi:hypothetical protein
MPGPQDEHPPILECDPSPLTSQVTRKCLESVEKYHKSECKPVDKVVAIHNIATHLATTTPQLTDDEINDSLRTYLAIIDQHKALIERASGIETTMLGKTAAGSKRAVSLGAYTGKVKKSKLDNSDFPWVVREPFGDGKLAKGLETTLTLLWAFTQDLKFMKSSIVNSGHAPPFPNSEWMSIITGDMVDLNCVISGSFTVMNN